MRSSRPYVQLEPAVIEQARKMDLLSYLRAYEPNNRKPPIPPRPKQENRAHVHEPGQNIRIDQSDV